MILDRNQENNSDEDIIDGLDKRYFYFLYDVFLLKNKNRLSIVDYFLDLARQFLTLSATGYIGLLVAPKDLFSNVNEVQSILIYVIQVSISLIFVFLVLKVMLINYSNEVLGRKIKIESDLFNKRILSSDSNNTKK